MLSKTLSGCPPRQHTGPLASNVPTTVGLVVDPVLKKGQDALISGIRTQTRQRGQEHRKPVDNKEPDSSTRGDNMAGNNHIQNYSNHGGSSRGRNCSIRDDGVCRLPGPEWPTKQMLKQPRVGSEERFSSSYRGGYVYRSDRVR